MRQRRERSTERKHITCFAKEGVRYYITTFDDLSADDLYLIAEELLD